MSALDARPAWEAVQQVDLFGSAWRLTEPEMKQILDVRVGTLQLWRHSAETAPWSAEIAQRIELLHALQYALWLRQPPGQCWAIWRRAWAEKSPIGARSLLDAVVTDGTVAIEIVTRYLLAQ